MKIPSLCHEERSWWAQLGKHTLLQRTVLSRTVTFVVEKTRDDCFHACTVDDICHVLSHVPLEHWDCLDTFVLRQPTRKQQVLGSAWGRLAYSCELGSPGHNAVLSGPAVFLEAHIPKLIWNWPASLDPADAQELERLRTDGHLIVKDRGHYRFTSHLGAIRATQLYRTLLHEIGHWLDWLEKVDRPSRKRPELEWELENLYFARPRQEREAYAHRYADSMRARLSATRVIPFPPIVNKDSIRRDGLDIAMFSDYAEAGK